MKVMTITARYIRICWSIPATNKHRREKLSFSNFLGFLSRNQTQLNLQKAFCREPKVHSFCNSTSSLIQDVTSAWLQEHWQSKQCSKKEFLRLKATERKYKQGKRKSKQKSAQQSYLMFYPQYYVVIFFLQVIYISVDYTDISC